ncbi:hypothetical protein [Paracoccus sp. Ld10]
MQIAPVAQYFHDRTIVIDQAGTALHLYAKLREICHARSVDRG